jgi:hypothetical protein
MFCKYTNNIYSVETSTNSELVGWQRLQITLLAPRELFTNWQDLADHWLWKGMALPTKVKIASAADTVAQSQGGLSSILKDKLSGQ